MQIQISIALDNNKLIKKNKSNRLIEGKNQSDEKMQYGYDLTANNQAYANWSGQFKEYLVKDGDTLQSIAKKFKVKSNTIALLNKKKGNMLSDTINEGQKILIPINEGGEIF